ncbi:copper resistance protein CopC [Corynebacterium riegelii]|uniref:copper resistance CopC family protein n=1 Tax=Corynebacterium riegelii TaxID=156976 RepID=UPI00254D87B1|nr:copper resistance protein CopC [Corynebacterium riegelii]MDK7179444.1 copper resistance protein CopC [Corynebacterium riegelii]
MSRNMSHHMSSGRGVGRVSKFAAAAVVAGALAASTPAALAHDAVIGGSPADKEVVTAFPTTLELEFSGFPKEGFSTIALSRDVDGKPEVLFSGEPTIEQNFVRLDLPDGLDVEPGNYRIGFQIISSDGHATKGMTTFTFNPTGEPLSEAAESTPDTATETADDEGNSSMRLVLAIVGLLVVAGAAVAALGKLRKGQGQ